MAKKDDTSFLKERVEKREIIKKPVDDTPHKSVVDNANTFIEEATADEKDKDIVRRKLHKRAIALDAADTTSDERAAERDERQAALDEENERLKQSSNISDKIRMASNAAQSTVSPLADKVGSLPTPGGNGFLLLILTVLLFTVVVVNSHGDTRLKQLWYMLSGQATIAGRTDVTRYNPPPLTSSNNSGSGSNGIPGAVITPLSSTTPIDTGLPVLDTGF